MYFLNTPGLIGIVLVVVLGHWLYAVLPPRMPGREELVIGAGALFLGLYALTVDRCEVPGLLPSYRANVQNFFAAMAEGGMGTYDKPVVPGRRLSFFFLPLVVAPWVWLLFGLGAVAYELWTAGTLSPLDRFRHLELPLAGAAVCACYAVATRSLRLRVRASTRESVH